MTRVNIDVPDDVHKEVKLAALKEDMTLKEFIISTLEEVVDDTD